MQGHSYFKDYNILSDNYLISLKTRLLSAVKTS